MRLGRWNKFAYMESQRLISVGAWVFGSLVFWKKPKPDTAAKGAFIGCRCCTMLTRDDSSHTRWVWPLLLCSCLQKAKNFRCQAGGLVNKPKCYCPHPLLNFRSAWVRGPTSVKSADESPRHCPLCPLVTVSSSYWIYHSSHWCIR